jgi:MEKHLA domain
MQPVWSTQENIVHAECVLSSYKKLTGRDLLLNKSGPADAARRLFDAPFVVLSHGVESDPVLNYGNDAALQLWEMNWNEFTKTPSRLTAESLDREERARLLAEVALNGFICDYSGVRISRKGTRFYIKNATVWNLVNVMGEPCGQAATFRLWQKI